jgi:hypothetical protein
MEHEGSLPCSEDPATGPNPEPDESSPYTFQIPPTKEKVHQKPLNPLEVVRIHGRSPNICTTVLSICAMPAPSRKLFVLIATELPHSFIINR